MKSPTYEEICDANNLMEAARNCMKGVSWKYSTQAYYLDRIERIRRTKKRLESRERLSDGFMVFPLTERGKRRMIRSIHINERVPQKTVNDIALRPGIAPRLIYDNGASMRGKGIAFALRRLRCHLERHYRKHGNDGYIAVMDLHAYFDSVQHGPVYEYYKDVFAHDQRITYLLMDFIDAFGEKSLGLGSEVSQITAIAYPNSIDHYIKEQLKVKGYGRYMDDSYMIDTDKDRLRGYLNTVVQMYADLGIEMNMKKTQIISLKSEFKFLKAKVRLTDSGKVVMRPDHDSIVRERRKMKKLAKKYRAGEMSFFDCQQAYVSWRGHIAQFDSWRTLQNMDNLFKELYGRDWRSKYGRGSKQLKYRGEFKRYDYPDRQDPAERRYGLEFAP